jgi:anthranilate phosphoribosyltransferase
MFNVLGPLLNPAKPKGMVLAVAEPELGHTFAHSLRDAGVKLALVVCREEKLDVLPCTPSWCVGESFLMMDMDPQAVTAFLFSILSKAPEALS